MTLTKAQWRTQVLKAADAETSQRWDATPGGEVDLLIATALDREWRRILNAYRFYRTSTVPLTADADGKYTKASLSTATARLYRIIGVRRDNVVYQAEDYQQNVGSELYTPSWYTWWDEGTLITLLPLTPSAPADFIINTIPPGFVDIATEGTAVTFPDGYELIPIYEAAALMLSSKAGAEHGAALELKQIAQEYREDMLSDIARISTRPTRVMYDDDAQDWGGG